MSQHTLLLSVAFAGVAVAWSGTKAVHYGESIAERFNLSSLWIGLVLLAILTSLPELVVTFVAQLTVKRPGLVFGNVCGSNLFNLLLFPAIDFLEGPKAVSTFLDKRLVRPAVTCMLVMGLALVGMCVSSGYLGHVHRLVELLPSFAIMLVIAFVVIARNRGDGDIAQVSVEPNTKNKDISDQKLILTFLAFGSLLVVSGIGLVLQCDVLVDYPLRAGPVVFRMKESLVGNVILAIVTSLPEVAVSLAAVRIGALNMATGNILGSCIFNISLLPIAHLIRPSESFWSNSQPVHILLVIIAIMLSGSMAAGIKYKPKKVLCRLGVDGVAVAVLGCVALLLTFLLGFQK
ncbi:sodium:calcium antiporter [Candidatus Hydrogenedentota bacterium]